MAAYSFVHVMGEKERDYIAYVQDLYENGNRNKMVQVRWFDFLEDVADLIMDMETHAKEVFMTPHGQDISEKCINGLATVLTPIHFDKCLKLIPDLMLSETFLCLREVRNNIKIKQFYVSELHCYSSQPVLSSLMSNVHYRAEKTDVINLSLSRCQPSTSMNDIEILSQDSGLRGCWFRCKILRVSQKCLRVQYYDVIDDDEHKNIEECVASHRVAHLDMLGMRHVGRFTVRPMLSEDKSDSTKFSVGSAVDAWWSYGWWEGILIGFDISSPNNLKLYLPGPCVNHETIKLKLTIFKFSNSEHKSLNMKGKSYELQKIRLMESGRISPKS